MTEHTSLTEPPEPTESTEPTTIELARRFLRATDPSDLRPEEVRELVAPDVAITDPLMPPVDSAAAFEAMLSQAGGGIHVTSTVQDVIGDERLVAARILVEVNGTPIDYAQWLWFEGDRITRVQTIYDPRPYLELAGG